LHGYFLLVGGDVATAMADYQQIFQLTQQMQGRLQQLQRDLAERTVEVQAGGGMVRVVVDGRGMVRALHIDRAAFEGKDEELLADLILSAIAEGQRRAGETLQAEMRNMPSMPFSLPL
jgi:nucleoid-associated protein EbfC